MTHTTSPETLRILIAEDNEDHQHLLLLSLVDQHAEAEVRVVQTGAQLLKTIRETTYDCVVADFNLPDFRANELIEKAAEHLAGTPVVVVSASHDQAAVIDSFRSGVVDFVHKEEALVGDALWRSVEHAVLETRRNRQERRERDRRERHLAQLAESDQLTGLYNRRYFDRCIGEGRWADDRRRNLSIVMFDIDHFKRVNDTYGHQAGDDVLCQTADFILTQIDGSDIAIRWGGEEFVILRPSTRLADSLIWAERLRRLIERRPIRWRDETIDIRISFGVHECFVDDLGAEAVERADAALYLAKERGRNQVCSSLMVQQGLLIDAVAEQDALGPEQRLAQYLDAADKTLGPTQREHLTTHAQHVATMAREIGRVLGLPEPTCHEVYTAGLLHDIGKAMIPESVLAKPGRLTLMERAVVARHAEFGAEIAERLGFDPPVVRCIREHHMRHDAKLPEDDDHLIDSPVGSRVLCAADALVSMMTSRSYSPAKSLVDALEEMRREKNRQFDPDVVNAAHFIQSLFSLAA